MQFETSNAPFLNPSNSIQKVMMWVILALLPGIFTMFWHFGLGVMMNLTLCLFTAIIAEALMLKLRGRPAMPQLLDFSAVVTALLLGLALPTLAPWWIPVLGGLIAIVLAKHLYGGLGYNPFNPAMIAFAILIVSFPQTMTVWALPYELLPDSFQVKEAFSYILGQASKESVDAITAATPLDEVKTRLGLNETLNEIQARSLFTETAGKGWESVSYAFLLGGIILLFKRIITWHIPLGVLAGLALSSLISTLIEPGATPSPLFHLLSGGAMLGAFFIATDPVTAAASNKGRLLYGLLIGVLTFIIRTWGGYPEGIAFAVLLVNMCVPLIDHYTQPRVYGHR